MYLLVPRINRGDDHRWLHYDSNIVNNRSKQSNSSTAANAIVDPKIRRASRATRSRVTKGCNCNHEECRTDIQMRIIGESPTASCSAHKIAHLVASTTMTTLIADLSTRSTIYQRHEARRVRTLALKDDPRPAVVRVLSGLPGFRIFVTPYQPSSSSVAPATGYVEEQRAARPMTTPAMSRSTPSLLSAAVGGFAGGFSQYLYSASPRTPSVAVEPAAALALYAPTAPSVAPLVVQRAASMSFLFGTKAVVQNRLPEELSMLGSVAAASLWGSLQWTMSRQPLGRPIAAATLYFVSYDTLKTMTSEKSALSTAVAGALAGTVFEGIRTTSVWGIPCWRSAVRTAPLHAMLFVTYEALVDAIA